MAAAPCRVRATRGGIFGSANSSLAIISKRVGLDRVLSRGGNFGFKRLVVRVELNLEKLEGNGSWLWFPFEVGGRVSEFHYWREPTWGESDPVAGGRFGQCCCGFKFG